MDMNDVKRSLRNRVAFTLVELLVSITLMLILISTVVSIFYSTIDIVIMSGAGRDVNREIQQIQYVAGTDIKGALPFNGTQRFVMENGFIEKNGTISYGKAGGHDQNAGDRLTFRATTKVRGLRLETVEITYELVPSIVKDKQKTIEVNLAGTLSESRPIFILRRTVKTRNPNNPDVFDQPLTEMVNGKSITLHEWKRPGSKNVESSIELSRYVVSFNIEYFADDYSLSQIDPKMNPCPPSDPLGDNLGDNDPGGKNPYRLPRIRLTLRIIDDTGVVRERVVPFNLTLPMG